MKMKRLFQTYGIVIMAGTVLNLAGSALAKAVIPRLYLDSLGTILASALCGYVPGILVGFFTNVFKGLTGDPSSFYYSVLNVLIAISAAWFSKKNLFRRFPQVLVTFFSFAVIGGILGSVLTWFLGGGIPIDDVSFLQQLQTDFLNDLLDKLVTVALAVGVLLALPEKVYEQCNQDGWREKTERNTRRGLQSLNTRIISVVTLATVLIGLVVSGISIKVYHDSLIGEQAEFAKDVSEYAAGFIDPERVGDYLSKGRAAEGYPETEAKLKRILKSAGAIQYMYAYRIEKDGCHVVFDLDSSELEGDEPGTIIPFDESFSAYIPDLLAGKAIKPLVSNDTYGWLLTVYQPIFDAKRVCQCYMAVDISMAKLMIEERIFITKLISLFLGFYIMILSLAINLAKNLLIKPINAMAAATGEFAYNSESARGGSVERIRSMNIHTGDEIENLYLALVKTVEDTASYISAVSEKNQAISNMQNGLLMVMADLVESRDQCTGDHIKNTAAYVKIIIDQMKQEGIYTEELTDEFVADVISSAPLHDIGKIKVPDAILNKPGRLTDEEFAVMKRHAAYGGEIIEDAISRLDTDDSGYLREAKNLALCHHEKWDGSGYPNGLKGEDIPLSARIMAVADVFDALVSRRSYKQGMPFEKAMSIIREGLGSHFDPKIAQAFMDAEAEVKKVSDEKSRT